MATEGTLHDAFIDELRDVYNAEQQITKALPKMIKAATSPELKEAFNAHLEETRQQIERLEQVFEGLEEKVRGKKCDGMAGIIAEGQNAMGEDFDDPTLDAVLVASAQRVEHYEMAAYGTLIAWAEAMGHDDAVSLLQENLGEEKATDEKLTQLAESGINPQAAERAHPQADGEEEEDESPARGSRSTSGSGRAASSTRSGKTRTASSRSGSATSGGRSGNGRRSTARR